VRYNFSKTNSAAVAGVGAGARVYILNNFFLVEE